jgi:uncharacterized protein YbjT (DUF2867 family)
MDLFTTAADNLVAAERSAGVAHHVALSVVGADRMPDSGYMRAKVAQESRIAGSGVPHTTLRATQFFEFAVGIADACVDGNTVRVPDALIQPVAATEVAAKLTAIAVAAPADGVVEFGGPQHLPFANSSAPPWRITGTAARWSPIPAPATSAPCCNPALWSPTTTRPGR